jgi:hypothetical protein
VLALAGGAGLSVAGIFVVRKGKLYYRTLVAKKTLLEERLGLLRSFPGYESSQVGVYSLGALATRRKVESILANPDAYADSRVKPWSLTEWAIWTLVGFAVFDIVATVAIGNSLAACAWPLPCTPLA